MSFELDRLGSVLLLAWLAVAVTARWTRGRAAAWGALLGAGVVAFVPIDGLALEGYVRAHLGSLSVPSQLGLVLGIARRLGGPNLPDRRDRRALGAGVLAAGLFLYPMSLGLSPFDPYRWGYGTSGLVALVGALAFVSWYGRLPVSTGALVLALLGYGLGLGASDNLWDYLVDPWIFLLVAARGVAAFASRGLRSRS